jgi:flagellar P-ring protein precursor FlgI
MPPVPLLLLLLTLIGSVHAARVKDVASVYGIRSNPLMGNGLVVGLNRSGDSTQNEASIRALANRLQALGVTISDDDLRSRNVAMVMVTASLPPSTRPGSALDVHVSSVGDARSLEGGILLLTPLFAANGVAVAAAQGPLVVGGYSVSSGSRSTVKNHPTVGVILRGATVEVEVPSSLDVRSATSFDLVLNDADFTTATRVAQAIDAAVGVDLATTLDGGTVRVEVTEEWRGRQPELLALIEAVEVDVDRAARVVVNERTGTVVIGAGVKVHPVSVAHGGLTIEVARHTLVSQPELLSQGTTQVIHQDTATVKEEEGSLAVLDGTTVGEVVAALNRMGVSPRDLIVILQAMQTAGGLDAEIESL